MTVLRKTSSSPKSGEERIPPPLHFPFSSFSLSLPLSYSTLLSSLFHHSICLPILDTWVPLSFFLTICTGLSKRNGAKFRELRDNFPKLTDWAVHGRSLCLAAVGREFSNGGNFFCTTLYMEEGEYSVWGDGRKSMERGRKMTQQTNYRGRF